jgi:hypothetical protein
MSGQTAGPASAEVATEANFFDRTETNYRNMETRAHHLGERIQVLCDLINGGQPREAFNEKASDRHPAAFDRCNQAETDMYAAMSALE